MLKQNEKHLTKDNRFYLPQFPVANLLRVEVFYFWRAVEAENNKWDRIKMCQRGLKLVFEQASCLIVSQFYVRRT